MIAESEKATLSGAQKGLPAGWYSLEVAQGVRLELPGIYEWVIEGVGRYIGKYTHSSRPLREYEANVAKILGGRPYRPKKPAGFRRIHRALADGHRDGRAIRLLIVENCLPENLSRREAEIIRERGTLNGRVEETKGQ